MKKVRIWYTFFMITHLLLDMDNTLYPASNEIDAGITKRMLDFIASFLNISLDEVVKKRKQALPAYGTTLEWLQTEYNLRDEQAYFEAIHPESEINELKPDPHLRDYLLSLNLPMTVLTNAPMSHAMRVLKFYNIDDIFLGIFDVTYHQGIGKPSATCFKNTLDAVGYSVENTLFVDDHLKYVRGYKAIGGQAVLVDELGKNESIAKNENFWYIHTIYDLKRVLTISKEVL